MYTKGIRKIFTPQGAGGKFSFATTMAENAGYKAMTFNGIVFVRVENLWEATCFHITDFTDNKED